MWFLLLLLYEPKFSVKTNRDILKISTKPVNLNKNKMHNKLWKTGPILAKNIYSPSFSDLCVIKRAVRFFVMPRYSLRETNVLEVRIFLQEVEKNHSSILNLSY